MIKLNAREELIKKKTSGVDPLVDSYLAGNEVTVALFKKATVLHDSNLKRNYVEAALLASSDLEQVADVLELPLAVVTFYRDVFFDVNDFDKLSKLEVVYEVEDLDERNMKLWSLNQGLDFISWRLGKSVALNPVDGLREMFTLCTYKSREALFSGNASESSKEATKWTKLSMDLARLLKAWVMDGDAAKKDIEMALASVNPTFESFAEIRDGVAFEDSDEATLGSVDPIFEGFEGLK